MSGGHSILNRRITKPCFHICSTYLSHSQALLYLYAQRAIADRTERAFGLLRYNLGGDRPSQTARITLSAARLTGSALECQQPKGGISVTAPPILADGVHSLPPILHIACQHPMPYYSKGPRGLSVLPWVRRICTTTAISPSPPLRQSPSRYAVHARHQLGDKELRYLRTLIVRAAIHQSLGRELLSPKRDNPLP